MDYTKSPYKYDITMINTLEIIVNSSPSDVDQLTHLAFSDELFDFFYMLIFNKEIKKFTLLHNDDFDRFVKLYSLFKKAANDGSLLTYSLLMHVSSKNKNTFFDKSLFKSIMNNVKTSINNIETLVMLDVVYTVMYNTLITDYQEQSFDLIYKIHELNPSFFSSPPISNNEFISIINIARMLNMDIFNTIADLKQNKEMVSISNDIKIC